MKILYTNADQFVNKRDKLSMLITDDKPDIIMITEVIPKNQMQPIKQSLLDIDDYVSQFNFEPNKANLGASGIRGVGIYSRESLEVEQVEFAIEGYTDHSWIEISTKRNKLVFTKQIDPLLSTRVDWLATLFFQISKA